jgi:CHAD domain-containing protein
LIAPTSPEPLQPATETAEPGDSPPAHETRLDGQTTPDVAPPTVDRPSLGRTPDVRGHDPWAEAGRKVLRFHLARMLARVPGVIAGEDPEQVHAMRVAARRMRAAWRVFGDGFEREARRRYQRDLREIGGRLGAVRDLDVLLEILSAYEAQRSNRGRAGLRPIRDAWVAERETRRVELIDLLGSEAFARSVAEYEEFAGTEGLAAVPVAPHSPGLVRTRMPATAWAAYQAVWAFDDHVGRADLTTLHQLRIAGKWLRYTLEFAREALEPEATPLIRRVVALQDHLGTQHDLHVAATLARERAAGEPALSSHEIASVDRFVHHLDDRVVRLGRTLGRTWRPLVAPDYRRRMGRALARL